MTAVIRTTITIVITAETAAKYRNFRKKGAKFFALKISARPATTGAEL